MLKSLLTALLAFFYLGHTPPAGEEPDPPAGDPPADDDGELPDLDADDPPAGDDPPSGDEPDTAAQLEAERQARQRAEKTAREATERLAAEQRAREQSARAQPSQEQQIFDAEEARLRDPAITAQEKWQIESNRTLRSNHRASQQALWNSQEMADKADYASLCSSKPVAKKYATRVEEKLAEIRKGGGNIERKLVLKMLIGDDIVEGRVKTSKKPAPAADGERPANRVDRGKPALARSDVKPRAGSSERDKRRARLDGQLI